MERTDFIDGLITMAGNGNVHTHSGLAIHIYVANTSMTNRFFYNADGEMLIVPQMGRLLLRTEMGLLEAAPGLKYKAAFGVAYGAGLRVSEVVA